MYKFKIVYSPISLIGFYETKIFNTLKELAEHLRIAHFYVKSHSMKFSPTCPKDQVKFKHEQFEELIDANKLKINRGVVNDNLILQQIHRAEKKKKVKKKPMSKYEENRIYSGTLAGGSF